MIYECTKKYTNNAILPFRKVITKPKEFWLELLAKNVVALVGKQSTYQKFGNG